MTVTNANFLQATGFRLVIDREKYGNIEYFVQGVQHPSVSLPLAEASYSRVTSVAQIGDKLEFGEVTFNMMLDEGMTGYTEMFNWMKRLVDNKFIPKGAATDTLPSSEADISLVILNSRNNQVRKIIYRNAFPINLGDVSMEASASDTTAIVVPVTFKYTYFDIT